MKHKSEYSEEFDRLRRNRMEMSFYKYGSLKEAYGKNLKFNIIESLKVRLRMYENTGNTEWLVDAANFCMIEFMYPQHPEAHFRATSSEESPGLVK